MNGPAERHRDWGESAALALVAALFFALPNRYTLGPPVVTTIIGFGVVLMCALSIVTTLSASRSGARAVMRGAAAVLGIGLCASMAKIVYLVVYHASDIQGIPLLETAVVIWVSNMIIFAVAYHWIGEGEFNFPKQSGAEEETPLTFLDYIYLSFSTCTAFSATDVTPLTTRARMLMVLEASISLTTIAVAAARAINILN